MTDVAANVNLSRPHIASQIDLNVVNLFVFAKVKDNGELKYTITQHLRDKSKHKKLKTPNDDAEEIEFTKFDKDYFINFYLCDGTDLGLSFDADPFWASAGSSCPPPAGIPATWRVRRVSSHRIEVFNPAGADQRNYQYMLRFKDKNQQLQKFDPVIKNGGGSGRNALIAYLANLLHAIFPFLRPTEK